MCCQKLVATNDRNKWWSAFFGVAARVARIQAIHHGRGGQATSRHAAQLFMLGFLVRKRCLSDCHHSFWLEFSDSPTFATSVAIQFLLLDHRRLWRYTLNYVV